MKRPPTDLAARLRAVADEVLAPNRAPSIDEMAAAAEIPRATLYYYFAGRDELVDFLLLDKVEAVGDAMRAAAGDGQDPLVQLEAVLSIAVRIMATHPTLCTMLLARMASLSQTELLSAAVAQSVLRPLQELLDAGGAAGVFEIEDAELSAQALYGAISMAALSQVARHGHIDADRLDDVLVPRLIASVRAPESQSPVKRSTAATRAEE
ncbi:MAG: TetR/AcrR family transcriptional regulator [Acidimicrobiia bacterium]